MITRATARAFAVTGAIVLVAALAAARPGGGQSFGGSRSSSSSSSGGFRSSSSSSSSSGGFRSSSSSSSSSGGFRSTSSSTSSSSSGGFRSTSSSTSSTSSSSGGFRSTSSSTSSSSSGAFGHTSSTSSSGYYSSSSSAGGTYVPVTPLPSDPTESGPSSPEPLPTHDTHERPVIMSMIFVIGAAAALVLLVVLYSRSRAKQRESSWDAVANEQEERIRSFRHANVTAALAAIRSADDAFSFVLFEDFLYALYAETHTARATGTLDRLAPYLSNIARAELRELPANGIEGIVIGGMRIESITTTGSKLSLEAVFTTNLAEKDPSGAPAAFYMEERWTLSRDASAKSRTPERARIIGCPSCGAPLDKMKMQKCGYCGVTAAAGELDWFVEDVQLVNREARGPMLTGTTEEVGTDWPTVVAPDARKELDALIARDPGFTWRGFVTKVQVVFAAFHESWSSQELAGVRPYLSDNLYELQRYWVQAYQQQGLHNRTESPTIVTVHLARITHDRFFDAVTVRVFASCVDYTTDESGEVVGGDRKKTREYTEYWTFIRGVSRSGAPRVDGMCPGCGAPLTGINMAGECTHCNAKVTSGEFDWVLSRIEQDEVYEAVAA